MKTNINLISSIEAEKVREGKAVGTLKMVAIAAVVLAGISSAISFVVVQQLSASGIKKQQVVLSNSINSLRPKQAKLILLNKSLVDIEGILKNRPRYDEAMNSLISLVPAGVSINTLTIDENIIALSVTSSSLLPLDELTENFILLVRQKKLIKSLDIDNLTADSKAGSYTLAITAEKL